MHSKCLAFIVLSTYNISSMKATTKSATLTVRLHESVKHALLALSEAENRSCGQEISALVLARCRQLGIEVNQGTKQSK